jgi:hypothetical protein
MAVSKLLPSGGANDFNLNITGPTTSVTFDKEYAAGSYSITSSATDTTLDFYAYNAAGTLVGNTATKAFTASGGFNKIVVLGGTVGDVIGFTFKKTFTTTAATSEVTAGPVISSVSPSALPKIDDSLTVTGVNFASDVTVTFSSTTGVYTSTAAKSIVRSNSTSLIVTRPDVLPIDNSPYTITVSNPGVPNPTGTNAHILANCVTAGVAPVWVTGSTLTYTTGTATSLTLSATDADAGSDIDYSISTGTLPSGLSLDGETGVISGTPSTSQQTVTFRAVDQGGNFVDKAILFNANPVWSTAAGALPKFAPTVAYSTTVTATDDAGGLSYSLVSGALPSGLTLASNGVISGTSSASGTSSFTVRVTDASGGTADRAFSLTAASPTVVSYSSVGSTTFTLPSSAAAVVSYLVVAGGGGGGDGQAAGGGGGAGGMIEGVFTLTPGSSYSVTVGGGGFGNGDGNTRRADNGGNSVFHTATSYGGGAAGSEYGNNRGSGARNGADGGSGGGGSGPNVNMEAPGAATIGVVPAGATGYGFAGFGWQSGSGNWGRGGGGGGAGGTGVSWGGGSGNVWGGRGPGRSNSITGSAVTYAAGGQGAGGTNSGGAASNGAAGTNGLGNGGDGTTDSVGGTGGSGIVVVKYFV